MRIGVYLGHWNLEQLGGMGVYLRELLTAVAASPDQRHEAFLLCDRGNHDAVAALPATLRCVWLDRPAAANLSRGEWRRIAHLRHRSYTAGNAPDERRREHWSPSARAYLWGLDDAAAAAGVDLLYFTIPPYLKRPALPYLLTIHDLKHVHRPQDHDRRELAQRRRWGRVARAAALVYASYEHVRADIVRWLGVPRPRTAVLPLASPEDSGPRPAARLPDLPDRPPRFALMPAQFWPHKNHAGVLHALAQLRRNRRISIPLVCTGQTDGQCTAHATAMRQLAADLGVADLFFVLGLVPRDTLLELYRRARFVVVATLYDPGSFPALEALRLGRPLAAARVTSIPEAVGPAALLFDPHEPAEIAEALGRLWSDDALCARLARLGPSQLPHRTWADVARDWLALCERAAGTSAPAPVAGAAAES